MVRYPLLVLILLTGLSPAAQTRINGRVTNAADGLPLAFVNIGIRGKNIGTASRENGTFSITIPAGFLKDTLTFSLVGYYDLEKTLEKLLESSEAIKLHEKTTELSVVTITAEKLVERKYGIKRRNLLLHFTDGMFQQDDIFEIGQLIRLRDAAAQIISVNLHINSTRKDSASFRLNFYRLVDNRPAERLLESSILQRHAIREGWLKFDLTKEHIVLNEDFVVTLELLPEPGEEVAPVHYEVKLGGSSRSFYRRNSLGQWNTPPHHYCMYVTALVDKHAPEPQDEDAETVPAYAYPSAMVKDTFHLFIRLPAGYAENPGDRYPVLYHLDGNAYFDHINRTVERLHQKGKLQMEPIVVGIGYVNAYVMDSLRVRDYTYPDAPVQDSFPVSGGGERFHRFITRELIPYIDETYRTDTTSRTILGHSFGGFYVLYQLLQDLGSPAYFDHYVAASPSLAYARDYLVGAFEAVSDSTGQVHPSLYLTTGDLEHLVGDQFDQLADSIRKRGVIQFESRIYKNLEHLGTAVPSFEDGILLIYGQ